MPKRTFGTVSVRLLYRPDALPVTQPTVSNTEGKQPEMCIGNNNGNNAESRHDTDASLQVPITYNQYEAIKYGHNLTRSSKTELIIGKHTNGEID